MIIKTVIGNTKFKIEVVFTIKRTEILKYTFSRDSIYPLPLNGSFRIYEWQP